MLDAVEPALSVLVERRVVMVDHSTTSPAGTAARVERMQARGVPYLHAPVFMSPNAARSAQGTMIVAGDPATFERVAPLLEPMTATLRHVGARADLAAAMKLFGNAMNLAMLHGLADILTMARELEIPEERALDVFSVIDVRYVLEGRGRKMAAQDVAPLWTVDVARKDLGLMMRCAGEAALPSFMWESVESVARCGINALAKGHPVAIPGTANRVAAMAAHLTPKSILAPLLARQHPALRSR